MDAVCTVVLTLFFIILKLIVLKFFCVGGAYLEVNIYTGFSFVLSGLFSSPEFSPCCWPLGLAICPYSLSQNVENWTLSLCKYPRVHNGLSTAYEVSFCVFAHLKVAIDVALLCTLCFCSKLRYKF